MKKHVPEIPTSEQSIVLLISILEGIGFAGGIAVDTVWILTSSMAEGGMGIAITAATAPFWAIGLAAGSLLILAAVSGYMWRSHHHKAVRLLHAIEEENHKKIVLEKLQNKKLFELLNFYFLIKENPTQLAVFEKELKSKFSEIICTDFLALAAELETRPVLKFYYDKIKNNAYDEVIEDFLKKEERTAIHDAFFISPKAIKICKPNNKPAIRAGIFMAAATYASLLGTVWGLTSIILGGIGVGALIATPVIGWSILAGAAVIAIVAGCVWAYCTHKNSQRKAYVKTLQNENTALAELAEDTEKKLFKIQKSVSRANAPAPHAVKQPVSLGEKKSFRLSSQNIFSQKKSRNLSRDFKNKRDQSWTNLYGMK